MIPSSQPDDADIPTYLPIPAISPPSSPKRHLECNLDPGTPIVRIEHPARPSLSDSSEEFLSQIESGFVRSGGEEDVAVSPGSFGCSESQGLVCVAMRLTGIIACQKHRGLFMVTYVNHEAEPSK